MGAGAKGYANQSSENILRDKNTAHGCAVLFTLLDIVALNAWRAWPTCGAPAQEESLRLILLRR